MAAVVRRMGCQTVAVRTVAVRTVAVRKAAEPVAAGRRAQGQGQHMGRVALVVRVWARPVVPQPTAVAEHRDRPLVPQAPRNRPAAPGGRMAPVELAECTAGAQRRVPVRGGCMAAVGQPECTAGAELPARMWGPKRHPAEVLAMLGCMGQSRGTPFSVNGKSALSRCPTHSFSGAAGQGEGVQKWAAGPEPGDGPVRRAWPGGRRGGHLLG
jgi:hypothetical protein